MKLMNDKIRSLLTQYPLYSQDEKPYKFVIAKYFYPAGRFTWYAVEGNIIRQETTINGKAVVKEDVLFFGYVLGNDPTCDEWGYWLLSQLEEIVGPYGITVERDMYFDNMCIDTHGNIHKRTDNGGDGGI